jgi:hypothetical protein
MHTHWARRREPIWRRNLLSEGQLKGILCKPGISKKDQLLITLAVGADRPKEIKAIGTLAVNAGAKTLSKVNVSLYLGRAKGLAIRTPQGWELTDDGKTHVRSLASKHLGAISPAKPLITNLRLLLPKLAGPDVRAFMEETIACLEGRHFRAAVVLSWVGAASVLQDHILAVHLAQFNTEATRRNPKWKAVKSKDDFGNMKESTFLDVLEYISVLGGNVKTELKNCLDLRNACGHPNSLAVGENRVAAHIESLILNVFTRFT